jgi:hypothetical protein
MPSPAINAPTAAAAIGLISFSSPGISPSGVPIDLSCISLNFPLTYADPTIEPDFEDVLRRIHLFRKDGEALVTAL